MRQASTHVHVWFSHSSVFTYHHTVMFVGHIIQPSLQVGFDSLSYGATTTTERIGLRKATITFPVVQFHCKLQASVADALRARTKRASHTEEIPQSLNRLFFLRVQQLQHLSLSCGFSLRTVAAVSVHSHLKASLSFGFDSSQHVACVRKPEARSGWMRVKILVPCKAASHQIYVKLRCIQ